MKAIAQGHGANAPKPEQEKAKVLQKKLTDLVNYAPWWVRVLSATCLGLGTMVGYKRIVKTLGEQLGKEHLAPAPGGIGRAGFSCGYRGAGFTGGPVSTTHVVTSGIAGTMVGSGAGVQMSTVWQIAAAWILTLPATILLSGGLLPVLLTHTELGFASSESSCPRRSGGAQQTTEKGDNSAGGSHRFLVK